MEREFLKEEGEKYHAFTLVKKLYIAELKSTLRELIHVPTGAQVMHLENNDPENLFCLSFKTLPESSNGAPHILEHTVLCGSRKYPVKDPFFAMTRRSLNTFMNALTGSDFTCYPAASQVEKDFYNLLEVYLDAVFHPLLKEESFLQEGCRLEFEDSEDPETPLLYKGIVYNEMKGALSSGDSRIWHAIMAALVPDLTYAHNSGGDPKDIPKLTYKRLLDFHEIYYHPSRCLFFFYGNFPLKKHLDFIEEHCLKSVPRAEPLDGIGHQRRFTKPFYGYHFYPTNERTHLENKHIHTFAWLTAPLIEQKDILTLTILDSILMDTDASPLKKTILDSKLCVQADCFMDTEMTEVPIVFFCRGSKENAGEKIQQVIIDELKRIAKEGIPYNIVEASIHQLEFARTEIGGDHSPFGLTLFMRSGLAKQHGCSPENALTIHGLFTEILEKAKERYFFTPFIEKYFLNNPHFVRLSFAPDPDLTAKEEEEEKKHLEHIKKGLSEKQVAHILDQAQNLEEFQKTIEGQKFECLPKVTLSDVPKKTRSFPLHVVKKGNLEIFHHDTFTNHILYADLHFDLPHYLSEEELFDLQIFLSFWGELGAGKRNYEENLKYIHAHTGGVSGHVTLNVQVADPMHAKPSLQLHSKVLARKADKMFHLFHDMITDPHFGDKKRIEELLKKMAEGLQQRLSKNAIRYATLTALSGFSVPNHISEVWHGLTFYNKLIKLTSNMEKNLPLLLDRLEKLKKRLLCAGTPHLILSCDEELYKECERRDFYGLPEIHSHPVAKWEGIYPLKKVHNQGRILSSPVAFTIQGYKTVHYLHPDSAALQVSTLLLDNKVLHHRIREKGGAYGAGANYNPVWGNFYLYAYRDPHLAHTLRTFNDAIDEMAAGEFDATDLEEAKLGIIQGLDSPTSPGARALVEYSWMREGKTKEMRQKFRDNLLHLTPESVQKAVAEHLQSQKELGVVVSFAGQEFFDKELPLLEGKSLEILPIS